jgi:hypothetical protein
MKACYIVFAAVSMTALAATPGAAMPPPAAPVAATVAVELAIRANPLAESPRMLRAGVTVSPPGKRERLFVEVANNCGTTGWVSVEDLN